MSTSGSIESRPLSGQRAAFDSEKCHSISIKQVGTGTCNKLAYALYCTTPEILQEPSEQHVGKSLFWLFFSNSMGISAAVDGHFIFSSWIRR